MKNIKLNNKKILIRTDFNVPIDNGKIIDNFRIEASIPTIKYCLASKASVVLISHLGRPGGRFVEKYSLDPIAFALEEILSTEVMFSSDCISDDAINLSAQMKSGEIHLLENLRFHKGEEENDPIFSWNLSRHGEIYINDAFGTSHRSHASNVGIIDYMDNSAIGLLMQKEKKYLSEIFRENHSPATLILGGSKVTDKIKLMENLFSKIDYMLIGGAMAFPFLKVKGYEVGKSYCDLKSLSIAKSIISLANEKNVQLIFPDDVVVSEKLAYDSTIEIRGVNDIGNNEAGYDIGPETTLKFQDIINTSELVIWNGPLGVCEYPIFSTGTEAIASHLSDKTNEGVITIIGGGDTASAINSNSDLSFTHISTGGGASLKMLGGQDLAAFKMIKNNE